MFCTKCGKEIPNGSRFCPVCGTMVKGANDLPESNPVNEQVSEPVNSTYQAPPDPVNYTNPVYNDPVNRDFGGGRKIILAGSIVFTVVYGIIFFTNFFSSIGGIFAGISITFNHNPVYGILGIISSFLGVIMSLIAACIAVLGVFLALKWIDDQTDARDYYNIMILAGILSFFVTLLRNIFAKSWTGGSIFALIWPLLFIASVFGLMMAIHEPQRIPPDFEAFKVGISDSIINVNEKIRSSVAETKAAKANRNAAAQAGQPANNAKFEGQPQGQQNYAYGNPTMNPYGNNLGPAPFYGNLKTNRGLLAFILLSIITCGIYEFFFIHSLAKDVNTACEGDGQHTAGLLKLILLSLITCGIYAIVWQYKLGNRLAYNANRYGLMFTENGTSVLLWGLFGSLLCGVGPFVAWHIILKNTNSLCMAYNTFPRGLVSQPNT